MPAQRLSAQPAAPSRILVMPFDNVKRDASIFWLGEAAAVLLTDDLNAIGAAAITRDERREAFERLQVPPTATLTDATAIRIGQLVGASDVITGSLQLEGGTLVVHARGLALETGRISHDVIERGPVPDLFATFDRAARRFAPATRPTDATNQPNAPLPAFESYIKGLLAETPATAVTYLSAALTVLPTFDRARLALWDVFEEQGDHAQGACRGDAGACRFHVVAPGQVSRGPVLAQPEKERRGVRRLQGAGRRAGDGGRAEQRRHRADPARHIDADGAGDLLLQQGRRAGSGATRTTASISATPIG